MEQALNMAVFCDYENLAIGTKESKYGDFDMNMAIERLHDKGKIVFKKAYADWERYKNARRNLHEHGFELVEIPHVTYSGKNSADIRLVVDALDLCHTKDHVDVFIIMSGDSDFSPLVNKLRENDKDVIGLGVKNSTSNLLVENCDEFIYYDDLFKRKHRKPTKKTTAKKASKTKKKDDEAAKQEEAITLILDTVESMLNEREGTLWAPSVRRAIKRKRPNFSESYFGFKNFNEIVREAEKRDLVVLKKDASTGHLAILELKRD